MWRYAGLISLRCGPQRSLDAAAAATGLGHAIDLPPCSRCLQAAETLQHLHHASAMSGLMLISSASAQSGQQRLTQQMAMAAAIAMDIVEPVCPASSTAACNLPLRPSAAGKPRLSAQPRMRGLWAPCVPGAAAPGMRPSTAPPAATAPAATTRGRGAGTRAPPEPQAQRSVCCHHVSTVK